jgi:hypothetical protein
MTKSPCPSSVRPGGGCNEAEPAILGGGSGHRCFSSVSRGASVGRGGGAAGSATASEDPFGCRGGGRFGIEGPVTTSKMGVGHGADLLSCWGRSTLGDVRITNIRKRESRLGWAASVEQRWRSMCHVAQRSRARARTQWVSQITGYSGYSVDYANQTQSTRAADRPCCTVPVGAALRSSGRQPADR